MKIKPIDDITWIELVDVLDNIDYSNYTPIHYDDIDGMNMTWDDFYIRIDGINGV